MNEKIMTYMKAMERRIRISTFIHLGLAGLSVEFFFWKQEYGHCATCLMFFVVWMTIAFMNINLLLVLTPWKKGRE